MCRVCRGPGHPSPQRSRSRARRRTADAAAASSDWAPPSPDAAVASQTGSVCGPAAQTLSGRLHQARQALPCQRLPLEKRPVQTKNTERPPPSLHTTDKKTNKKRLRSCRSWSETIVVAPNKRPTTHQTRLQLQKPLIVRQPVWFVI